VAHLSRQERRLRLLACRASARYRWRWTTERVAGREWKLATAADPDGMLIEACRRQDAGEAGVIDPFWATVWRAAAGLDCFLDRYSLQGTRVLELGCGTGHAGLSAALRGAQVTLTDGVTDPLLLVQLTSAPVRQQVRVRRLRFGEDRLRNEAPFPLILGSDVTYLRHLWPQLQLCVREHLAPGGELLLSDPYRLIANEFRDYIRSEGWYYEEHRIEPDGRKDHPIRVMRVRCEV
jgi:predicted nicotinamide N-methyase